MEKILVASMRNINPFPNKPWFLCVCSTCLLKTMWEKEKLLIMLLFPHCFLPFWRTFCHFHQIQNCMQTLSVWKSLKFVVWEKVNTFLTFKNPFENIVGKEENAGNEHFLVTSIFSLFHNVFYPYRYKYQCFIHIYFMVCKCF